LTLRYKNIKLRIIEVIAKLQMWTGFSPEKGVEKGGHFWHDGVSQAHINALL
jgi:hypothetical protein